MIVLKIKVYIKEKFLMKFFLLISLTKFCNYLMVKFAWFYNLAIFFSLKYSFENYNLFLYVITVNYTTILDNIYKLLNYY